MKPEQQDVDQPPAADPADVLSAARLIALETTEEQASAIAREVARHRGEIERLREASLRHDTPSALRFVPLGSPHAAPPVRGWDRTLPDAAADAAEWADIPTLSALLRARKVTCVELAQLALRRLEALDPVLHCVVTLTRERALEQAAERDRELDAGRSRGILHGIPWGAKDLLAVCGYPTTWGSAAYRDQMFEADATVVRRLDDAGAVLVAKLTLGELAMGDKWFGGMTRNPWIPEAGSSGSSAGSASAVAAGCVAFALGTETLGSIVSPSAVCGCSSLRPTYGTVSRHGAMALAPTLDKIGPMCRTVRDASIVYDAIRGPDELDPSVVETAYVVPHDMDLRGLRVGFLERPFEKAPEVRSVLSELEALGVELVALSLPRMPADAMLAILSAESAESFDELTLSGRDALLLQDGAWRDYFRAARLFPAVEYLRANRLRRELMVAMDVALADIDVYVHPATTRYNLSVTNLTGHPSVVAPCGFGDDGAPRAIAFTSKPYRDSSALAVAHAWQRSTEYHLKRPSAATGR